MLRKINRMFQDYMRPKRLALGKFIWDRKDTLDIKKGNVIEEQEIKSIIFMRYDGKIGDMIINTLMFREIKKKYPYVKIGVVTRGAARDIIESNPNVDVIYDFNNDSLEEISKDSYDLLIDFNELLRVKHMKFINKCKARINMGLNKDGWKLFDISITPNIDFKWTDHITKRYQGYLSILGVKTDDLTYEVPLKEEVQRGKYAIINPYGASKHKTLSFKRLEEIIEVLEEQYSEIKFIYSPNKKVELEEFLKKLKKSNVKLPKVKNIVDSIEVIGKGELVVTPDTSIVHIANALNKNMVCIYPPRGGEYGVDHEVWGPTISNARMIFCKDKEKGEEIDINTFNMEELRQSLEEIIEDER